MEAQFVILFGREDQLLPCWQSLTSRDPEALVRPSPRSGTYVAATGATERLLITHAAERCRRPTGGPSRFLAEAGLTASTAQLAA